MNQTTAALPEPRKRLAGVQWRWVLPAGVGAPIVAVALWVALIFLYVIMLAVLARGAPDGNRIGQFGSQGVWAVPVLTLALTIAAASWVARKAGTQAATHGTLVGVVSTLGSLAVWGGIHGMPGPWEWAALALTVGAGYLGGLEAQSTVAGQEALYRSGSAIAAARSPQAIVDTIGEYLAGPRVGQVALWEVVAQAGDTPAEIALRAAWAPIEAKSWSPSQRLRADQAPALARLRRDTPAMLEIDALPSAERAEWERLDVRSAILLPLIAPGGAWIGLLMVTSPTARGFSKSTLGRYLAVGAQAALALENLRLVEQGRQIGALAERQRLAREIHDAVKQQVFAAGMQIAAARALIERDPDSATARLGQAEALVRQAQEELAAVIHELRPAALEGKGLAAVLREYAADWSRQSDIPTEVRVRGEQATPLETEQALFRVAQEALANVAKHSRATAATVDLEWCEGLVTLRVADDGRGFAPADDRGQGYGLSSMRERVAALGGRVVVESQPGQGTRVICACPLDRAREGGANGAWPNP